MLEGGQPIDGKSGLPAKVDALRKVESGVWARAIDRSRLIRVHSLLYLRSTKFRYVYVSQCLEWLLGMQTLW
jgi:hypothetical protein